MIYPTDRHRPDGSQTEPTYVWGPFRFFTEVSFWVSSNSDEIASSPSINTTRETTTVSCPTVLITALTGYTWYPPD